VRTKYVCIPCTRHARTVGRCVCAWVLNVDCLCHRSLPVECANLNWSQPNSSGREPCVYNGLPLGLWYCSVSHGVWLGLIDPVLCSWRVRAGADVVIRDLVYVSSFNQHRTYTKMSRYVGLCTVPSTGRCLCVLASHDLVSRSHFDIWVAASWGATVVSESDPFKLCVCSKKRHEFINSEF
jgi:hypothetical protein